MPPAVARLRGDRRPPRPGTRCAASATWTPATASTRCSAAGPGSACAARRCTPRSAARAAELGDPGPAGPGDRLHPGRRRRHGRRACGPATWSPPTGCTRLSAGPAALDPPPRPPSAVRAAPALPARAVDRPGRGALVARGPRRTSRRSPTTWSGVAVLGGARGDFDVPARRVPGAARAAGRGRRRQRGPRRRPAAAGRAAAGSAGSVLLVGDASGYLDALTGEGIGAALAQAAVLAECLAAGRPGDYERAWRRVSRKAWMLTVGPAVVPAPAAARHRASSPPRSGSRACSPPSST